MNLKKKKNTDAPTLQSKLPPVLIFFWNLEWEKHTFLTSGKGSSLCLLYSSSALPFIHPFSFFLVFWTRGTSRALALLWTGKWGIWLPFSSSASVSSDSRLVCFPQLHKSTQLLPRKGNVFLELLIHASSDFKLFTTMLSICEWAWRKINMWQGQSRKGKTVLPTPFSCSHHCLIFSFSACELLSV